MGYSESAVYSGIPEALKSLAAQGTPMAVCTSKRVDFAERVLAQFGLLEYFGFVRGGNIGVQKQDQLRALIDDGVVRTDSVMIGDRVFDISAARANGLFSVGVLWGHGSLEELTTAAPDRILDSPNQLPGLAQIWEQGLVPENENR